MCNIPVRLFSMGHPYTNIISRLRVADAPWCRGWWGSRCQMLIANSVFLGGLY
jgi:hypothetical protein